MGDVGILTVDVHADSGGWCKVGTMVWVIAISGPDVQLQSLDSAQILSMPRARWPAVAVIPTAMPECVMQDRRAFIWGYFVDRATTLREMMYQIADTWLNDGGRAELAECLARWAEDGVNLSNINDVIGLAEGHFED